MKETKPHWELIKNGTEFDIFQCTNCGYKIRIYPDDNIENYPQCVCGSFMVKSALKQKLKLLCIWRDKVGKVPWVDGSRESMNAKIELARIDDLIVQTVMQMWYKRKVRHEESK